jgi:hypothetical protein
MTEIKMKEKNLSYDDQDIDVYQLLLIVGTIIFGVFSLHFCLMALHHKRMKRILKEEEILNPLINPGVVRNLSRSRSVSRTAAVEEDSISSMLPDTSIDTYDDENDDDIIPEEEIEDLGADSKFDQYGMEEETLSDCSSSPEDTLADEILSDYSSDYNPNYHNMLQKRKKQQNDIFDFLNIDYLSDNDRHPMNLQQKNNKIRKNKKNRSFWDHQRRTNDDSDDYSDDTDAATEEDDEEESERSRITNHHPHFSQTIQPFVSH